MNETNVVRSLAALAQDVRLRIFRSLVVAGKDGLTPGDLGEKLGVAATEATAAAMPACSDPKSTNSFYY